MLVLYHLIPCVVNHQSRWDCISRLERVNHQSRRDCISSALPVILERGVSARLFAIDLQNTGGASPSPTKNLPVGSYRVDDRQGARCYLASPVQGGERRKEQRRSLSCRILPSSHLVRHLPLGGRLNHQPFGLDLIKAVALYIIHLIRDGISSALPVILERGVPARFFAIDLPNAGAASRSPTEKMTTQEHTAKDLVGRVSHQGGSLVYHPSRKRWYIINPSVTASRATSLYTREALSPPDR